MPVDSSRTADAARDGAPEPRAGPADAAGAAGPDSPVRADPNGAFAPAEIARKVEQLGVVKARTDALTVLVLAGLAGAFISLGALFFTVVVTGSSLGFGVTRLLGGLVFALGLILVVIGGAELFTGDNLMVMAWAGRRITFARLMRVWAIVFAGNAVGAVGTAALTILAGHYTLGGGAVGVTALKIAAAKASLPAVDAFFLGILCNVLVCLAVWMTFSARTVAGKVAVIVPPIAAFVAAGFEHSIANLYFLPAGLAIREVAGAEFWQAAGTNAAAFSALTVGGGLRNLAAVTAGNIVGGAGLVGAVYWFVYLRRRPGGA